MRLAYEKIVLRNLTETIENPDKKDSQIKKVCWGITIVSWCLLLAAYLLAFRDQNPTLIAVLASFAGIAYGRTMSTNRANHVLERTAGRRVLMRPLRVDSLGVLSAGGWTTP